MKAYALDNFMKVMDCMEFRQLDQQPLMKKLKNDNLSVHSAEDVFDAVRKLLKFNCNKRESLVPELIGMVRMNWLDPSVN